MRPRIVIPTDLDETTPGQSARAVLREPYYRLVLAAGGLPVLAPPLDGFDDALAAAFAPHGLLLTGGADLDPARFGQPRHPKASPLNTRRERAEFAWMDWADRHGAAVLGICLGCQVINVARGGSLVQYLGELGGPLAHASPAGDARHDAVVTGPRLRGLIGERAVGVNSRHQQAVDRVGAALVEAARATDGVIEAVEGRDERFVLGIQWHMEDLPDHPATRAIAAAFIAAAERYAQNA